ncbi:MAG: SDR family oxidoreductase, partial [Actinotalea sp.]|nr:SDR family oxidoreductase [Actinotalea sp.]
TGRQVPVLHVKGSGHDMAAIGPDGFAPLRLERLRELLPPVVVPDDVLADELRCALLDPAAPDPSVETLVHALLPHTAVLHSHADALLALTDSVDGERRVRELLGDRLVVVDYAMPGPDLVAACAAAWAEQADERTEGLVVLQHGLFTVGADPQEALGRHHAVLAAARAAVPAGAVPDAPPLAPADPVRLAALRRHLSELAGRPLVVRRHDDAPVRAFVADSALLEAAARGPMTPDHVVWTRRVPAFGTDLDAYAQAYRAYVEEHRDRRGTASVPAELTDTAPRVVLDPALGMLTAGRTAGEADAAADVYRHTMAVVTAAESLGGYAPPSAEHVFDLEYWAPQQAKTTRRDPARPLAGQVALVTGAASGIGRACAAALLEAGAAVVGWDVSPACQAAFDSPEWLGLSVDVTDTEAVDAALRTAVDRFGGLDVVVVAAGIFPSSSPLGELSPRTWRRTMAVNVDAVAYLYGRIHPLLALAPTGGRVVVVASKNVAAPGPGAAAYSASKAALTQLSRVAALEWAPDGIRVNLVHPDAVFDTGLWTPELLAARAAHYGMSVDDYKRRNLLHTEVTSAAVGRLVRAMADDTFACTTGAQVPIDGGNERVI